MLKRLISVILVLSLVLAGISAAFADSLRIGSRGDEVTKLQKALQKLGLYSMKVDGVYGQGTFAAVQAFQKKYGLKADGIAGAKTLAKLYGSAETSSAPAAEAGEEKKDAEEGKEETAVPDASGTMRQGDRGENVKQLQAKLKDAPDAQRTEELYKELLAARESVGAKRGGAGLENKLSAEGVAGARSRIEQDSTMRSALSAASRDPKCSAMALRGHGGALVDALKKSAVRDKPAAELTGSAQKQDVRKEQTAPNLGQGRFGP